MKDIKCPVCGHNLSDDAGDSSYYIKFRLQQYSNKTAKLLKAVHRVTSVGLPSQDIKAFRNFLYRIEMEDIEEYCIQKGCTIYLDGGYINQGKGLAYVHGIIKISGKDNKKLKEMERKLIGTSPPKYED